MICKNLESCVNEELSGKKYLKCGNNKEKCIQSSDNRSAVKCEEKEKNIYWKTQ